jgi:hypothetical protein
VFDTAMPRRPRTGLWVGIIAAAAVIAMVVTYLVTRGSTGAATPAANTSPGSPTSTGSTPPGSSAPASTDVTAPADGAIINKASLATVVVTLDGPAAEGATISIDGATVPAVTSGTTLTWKPATPLADGRHALVIAGAGLPGGKIERSFTVDTTAPKLMVAPLKALAAGQTAVRLTGTSDPGQMVTAADQTATATATGAFVMNFAKAPAAFIVEAKDNAGNVTDVNVSVISALPVTRAVHMTASAWAYKPLHDPVMKLLKAGRLTAIELDIKDEDGYVSYASHVPLVQQTGAAKKIYDARKAIDEIHAAGGRVIGRLVCFRDPTLAAWAWSHGHQDAVIQTPGGVPFVGTYGGGPKKKFAFTNFANKLVRDYNNDIAVEAAKLGFDDILFDYVRRPDGKMNKMKIVGVSKVPAVDVAEFVHETRLAIAAAGTKTSIGVSVFGIAATRPAEIAQDIPLLGKYVDYVAPMVYPSHWGPGEYKLADPTTHPYEIVQRSLKDFQKDLKGTNATVVPWLQDFYGYTAAQVTAQIKAAHDDGIDSYLLWNAGCTFTDAAIQKA